MYACIGLLEIETAESLRRVDPELRVTHGDQVFQDGIMSAVNPNTLKRVHLRLAIRYSP
jgi:hypothetical protein